MERQMIKIPAELQWRLNRICSDFSCACYNLCEPEDADCFILLKLIAICNALLVKEEIPLYMPKKEKLDTMKRVTEFLDAQSDEYPYEHEDEYEEQQAEFGEALMEVLCDYTQYCRELVLCLTSFGWELVESHSDYFGDANKAYTVDDVLGSKRLSAYPDFLEIKRDIVEKSLYYLDRELHIFINKRLGKYIDFALTHAVDKKLHAQIQETLSGILGVWGQENVVSSNKPDGYEIAYVLLSDTGNLPSEEECAFADIDLFLPIHAVNLEKLLDKAYAMYPIEKEERGCKDYGRTDNQYSRHNVR